MPKKSKRARYAHIPKVSKVPLISKSPESFDTKTFVWRVSDRYIDYRHPQYGWAKVDTMHLLKSIIKKLQDYETQTWHEIKCKHYNHSWKVPELPGDLQQRLRERRLDLDELFQIGFGSIPRLFGYKELQNFYLMWYDKDHKIYPTKAK